MTASLLVSVIVFDRTLIIVVRFQILSQFLNLIRSIVLCLAFYQYSELLLLTDYLILSDPQTKFMMIQSVLLLQH